mgnify:CR=1 FL=1
MSFNFILIWNFFFATMVSFCRNSLYSIISLVFLIVGCCFILFYLEVEFLTFILLLIYIGALSVLFLFVVMMLKLDQSEKQSNSKFTTFSTNYLLSAILSLKLFCITFLSLFGKKILFCIIFGFTLHFWIIVSITLVLIRPNFKIILFLVLGYLSEKYVPGSAYGSNLIPVPMKINSNRVYEGKPFKEIIRYLDNNEF